MLSTRQHLHSSLNVLSISLHLKSGTVLTTWKSALKQNRSHNFDQPIFSVISYKTWWGSVFLHKREGRNIWLHLIKTFLINNFTSQEDKFFTLIDLLVKGFTMPETLQIFKSTLKYIKDIKWRPQHEDEENIKYFMWKLDPCNKNIWN